MPDEPPKFAFIKSDGTVENVSHCRNYYEVLDFVHRIVLAVSGNQPLPKALLRDGLIIIDRELHQLGYQYGMRRNELQDALEKQLKLEFPLPVS